MIREYVRYYPKYISYVDMEIESKAKRSGASENHRSDSCAQRQYSKTETDQRDNLKESDIVLK